MKERQKGVDLVRCHCGRRFFSICCVKKKKNQKTKKIEPFRCFILLCNGSLMPLLAELTCRESHQSGSQTHGKIFLGEKKKKKKNKTSVTLAAAGLGSFRRGEGGR